MSYSYKKVIKPKSNKQSSSRGGKETAKKSPNPTNAIKRRKEATKDWPWWVPK